MKRSILTSVLALATLSFFGSEAMAQQRPLDHSSYDEWRRIQGQTLSPDGDWLAYSLVPGDGDGELEIRSLTSGASVTIPRGTAPTFTDDSDYLVFTIRPTQEALDEADAGGGGGRGRGGFGGRGGGGGQAALTTRNINANRRGPADTLAIVDLGNLFRSSMADLEALTKVPQVESHLVPEEDAAVVAYLAATVEETDDEEEAGGRRGAGRRGGAGRGGDEAEDEDEKATGSTLTVMELGGDDSHSVEDVTSFAFTEDGSALYYARSNEDGTADGVYRMDPSSGQSTTLMSGEGEYTRLTTSRGSGGVAFLSNRDEFGNDQPAVSVYVAQSNEDSARAVAGAMSAGVPAGFWISDNAAPRFSESGERVIFGTAPRPEPEPEEDEDEEEMAVLDVWNWKDPLLQPMQLVQANQERNRTFDAWVPVEGGPIVQLETPDLPNVQIADGSDGDVAIGETSLPYRQLVSWDGTYNDVYVMDAESGEMELAVEMIRGGGGGNLSPNGHFVTWWDGSEQSWFAYGVESGVTVNMTENLPHPVYNELDDHPQDPPSYGSAGWFEDDRAFLVYDRHDIWAVDPTGESLPRSLTEGMGRADQMRFRYVATPDEDFVPEDEEVLLSAFDMETKDGGFYQDHFGGGQSPEPVVMGPHRYSTPQRAEDADRFLFTRQTFTDFPDLYVSGPDLSDAEKVSNANPQQAEYSWGTSELVSWTSVDGVKLDGLLYKPDGFDPDEKYPMMVYFYERNSDNLHNYTVPAPGSSSINYAFYVSRGYLLFVPDIPYEIGHPGESAMDAVVPGVLSLVDQGFVQEDKIGVQGHSWGGYQIAHMITKTNLFAAAEAGAPVANMTSAYGGIRWQTGMSRMFQYERTQSRIGGTLWNAQQLYIENSPIFSADKIQTPLLMMHNDEDGAVPWYQGIEMFVSMRRLQKPVWMLNYNGEAHGLGQDVNRRDWAMRMQQFFDHYLMDAPSPVWMEEGVPAILKGKSLGLQLITAPRKPISEQGGD